MVDWTHLLVSYWWMIAIGIAVVFVITRIHNFFRFFTTLISMVALFYAATILLIPPGGGSPAEDLTKVLGVSTKPAESEIADPVAESSGFVEESTESVEETQDETEIIEQAPVESEASSEDGCPDTISSSDDFKKCVNEWKGNMNFQIPGL